MGKKSSGKLTLATKKAIAQEKEGLMRVQFFFDGKVYTLQNQCLPQELAQMKRMCEMVGYDAVGSYVWNLNVSGAMNTARDVVRNACESYIKNHGLEHVLQQYRKPHEELGSKIHNVVKIEGEQ